MQTDTLRHVRHNFAVNLLDAAFFGWGLGFASFVTILPLFVATMTDSAVLIGLVVAVHNVGWQLPQVFTANFVARLRRYKPAVLAFSIHERWPFLALALVAWQMPVLGRDVALALTLLLLVWHSIGGGVTANPWQSMIGKIIPERRRGTFYGFQSAAANLLASAAAIAAGAVLIALPSPDDFALCFLITGIALSASWVFLSRTREAENAMVVAETRGNWREFAGRLGELVRADANFRWFLIARVLAQFTTMGVAFYTIFAVRRFGMDEQVAGLMTSVLLLGQTLSAPLLGWVGDRWGHRRVFAVGVLLMAISALVAMTAPALSWFYVAFALAGVANSVLWTTAMSITSEFGDAASRPYYIGLTNTVIAPATLVAPLLGGWLADTVAFEAAFLVTILFGLATTAVLQFMVRDPRHVQSPVALPVRVVSAPAGD